MNKTHSAGMAPEIKEFYDKVLLERALPNLPFLKYAQKRPIPKNNGKTIEFRKFHSLAPATTPLTEGNPPVGKDLTITSINATVEQYGDFVEVSDVLTETAIDPIITETIELEGEQSGETLNTVARNVLLNATSVFNVGAGLDEDDITANDILTADDVLKLRTILKRANIKPAVGKYYLMFLAPEQAADIMRDKLWQDVNTYSKAENIEDGEIGKIHSFKFIDTTLLDAQENLNGVSVYSGIAIGKDAYGMIDVENSGKPKSIIKLAKNDNTDKSDPLNQKSTIGWKAMFTTRILNNLAVIRVNSAATAVDAIATTPSTPSGGNAPTQTTPTRYTVSAVAGENGTVTPSSISVPAGANIAISGNVITIDNKTIAATANANYRFREWNGIVNGGTVSNNASVTAIFESDNG